MSKISGLKQDVSRPPHSVSQKLVTIELASGGGFQWHLTSLLNDGWRIIQVTAVPGGSVHSERSPTQEVTAWLAVLLERSSELPVG